MKIRTNVISYNIRKYERVNIFTGTKTIEIKIHRGGKSPARTKFSRVQRTFTQSKSSSIGWQKSLGVGDVCYARWVVGKRGCALSGADKRVIARFASAMANSGSQIRGRASFSKWIISIREMAERGPGLYFSPRVSAWIFHRVHIIGNLAGR